MKAFAQKYLLKGPNGHARTNEIIQNEPLLKAAFRIALSEMISRIWRRRPRIGPLGRGLNVIYLNLYHGTITCGWSLTKSKNRSFLLSTLCIHIYGKTRPLQFLSHISSSLYRVLREYYKCYSKKLCQKQDSMNIFFIKLDTGFLLQL